MNNVGIVFSVALIVAWALTPLVRLWALRMSFMDHPAERKFHDNPIPLLGGAAIFAGVLIPLIVFALPIAVRARALLIGASLLAITGAMDDRYHLPWMVKMIVQVAVACGFYYAGIRVRLDWLPNGVNVFFTFLWIIGITNAINFLDNMDGLAAGISAIAAVFFTFMALQSGQIGVAVVSAAVLGASVGFLFHNREPARIFMGDTGSLFLGVMLAAIGLQLRFPERHNAVTWMVPVLVLAVPVFDTTLVTLSRLKNGRNPLATPGKDHVSHRLVTLAGSVRKAVMILYLLSAVMGGLALWLIDLNFQRAYIIAGSVILTGIGALVFLEKKTPYTYPDK